MSGDSRPAVSLTMFPPTQISCDYCCVTLVSFSSTCVTPGISRHTYPGGEPCVYCHVPKGLFFAYRQACHFRPRVSSRALGRGARRGSACTLGTSLGSGRAPWRVFSAFKVAKSATNHWIHFRRPRAKKAHRNP